MSSKLHGLVWEGCAYSGMILSRVAVMARLADYSNDEGFSWPAIETIRRQIGAKSESTVKAAIAELAKGGWLKKTERKSGGRNLSNVYQINVEKLEAVAADARKAYRPKKQVIPDDPAKFNPPIIDPPINDGSTVDPSNFDPSNVDGSTVGKTAAGKGAIVAPDPSVTSKHDPSDLKISCPVAEQPDDPAVGVLEYFNQVTHSDYGKGGRTKTTLGYIRGRLAEDYSAADLMLVIDYLTAKWAEDPRMDDYLRPRTLFGPENCAEYFEKAKKWRDKGRPRCVNGRWSSQTPFEPGAVQTSIPPGFRG